MMAEQRHYDHPQLTEKEIEHDVANAPAARFSGENVILAARAAGAPFEDVLRERVLNPLGMSNTGPSGAHLVPRDFTEHEAGDEQAEKRTKEEHQGT